MDKTKDMLADSFTEEIEQGKAIISGVTIEDFGDCLEELVSPELNRREPFSLSINFFEIPSNIQLLKCCQQVRIKLVDYKKFPHYFRHCVYIKGCDEKRNNESSFDNLDDTSTVSHNCEAIDDEESYTYFVKDIISLENTMAPITDNVQSIDVLSQHSNEYKYIKPKNPSNHRTLQNIPLYTSRPGSTDYISNYEQKQLDKTGNQNTNMDVYFDKSYDNMMEKEKYCSPGCNYYNYYNIHAPYLNFNQTKQPFQNNNCYYTYPCYPYSYIPYSTQNQPRAPYCFKPVPLTETSLCKKQILQNTKKSSDKYSGKQVKNNTICEYFKESDSSRKGSKTINITGSNQAIGVKSNNYCGYSKQFTHNIQMKRISEINMFTKTRQITNDTVINCSEENKFPKPIKNEYKPNYSGKSLTTKSISKKSKDYLDFGNNSEKHATTDSVTGNRNEKTNINEYSSTIIEEIKTYGLYKHKDTNYPHKKYNHVKENQFTKSKSENLRDYVQQNQKIKKGKKIEIINKFGKQINEYSYNHTFTDYVEQTINNTEVERLVEERTRTLSKSSVNETLSNKHTVESINKICNNIHKNIIENSIRSNNILKKNPELKKILDAPPIISDKVVKQNLKTVTGKYVNNTGYSPPILPIPTFQESFDILENMKFVYLDNARILKCAGRFGYDEQGMLAQKRKMNHQGSGSIPKRISLENYHLKK